MRRYPIERIEQAFTLWEDALYINECTLLALNSGKLPVKGGTVLLNWREFRRYLVETQRGESFDEDRFAIAENMPVPKSAAAVFVDFAKEVVMDSHAFFGWTTSSRKVFHVSSDLSHLLANTSLGSLSWDEVGLPFEGFAVTLDEPIMGAVQSPTGSRMVEFDCFIVYRDLFNDRRRIKIACYQRNLRDWKAITRLEKQRYAKYQRNGEWLRLAEGIERRSNLLDDCGSQSLHYTVYQPESAIVRASVEETRYLTQAGHKIDSRYDNSYQFFELIGGLCMYLKTFSGHGHHKIERMVRNRHDQFDSRAIIWDSEVTTVANDYTLTPEEKKWLESTDAQKRFELSSHWRRGHWRRPAGLGHIPEAEKTVWVRPTLVREDRLPPGSQPGGSRITLKTPLERPDDNS